MDTVFTPWQSLGGGALIGLAATLLVLTLGRIMGATGILAGVLTPSASEDRGWRLAVLLGMVSGPPAVMAISGQMPPIQVPVSLPMLLVGGIVEIGVTYGSGCTSGHGVCGVARLSRRSIAAKMTFMIMTGLTVYAIRHLFGELRDASCRELSHRPDLRNRHLDLGHGQSGQGAELLRCRRRLGP